MFWNRLIGFLDLLRHVCCFHLGSYDCISFYDCCKIINTFSDSWLWRTLTISYFRVCQIPPHHSICIAMKWAISLHWKTNSVPFAHVYIKLCCLKKYITPYMTPSPCSSGTPGSCLDFKTALNFLFYSYFDFPFCFVQYFTFHGTLILPALVPV